MACQTLAVNPSGVIRQPCAMGNRRKRQHGDTGGGTGDFAGPLARFLAGVVVPPFCGTCDCLAACRRYGAQRWLRPASRSICAQMKSKLGW